VKYILRLGIGKVEGELWYVFEAPLRVTCISAEQQIECEEWGRRYLH